MSSEDAEIVRRAFEAALRKPKPDFATVNALFDPDHELISVISAVEGRSYTGAHGFREWLADIDVAFDDWKAVLADVKDAGGGRVMAVMTLLGHSRGAGVEVEYPAWFIVTVRNGKLVRTESYDSEPKALEAAGLAE